MTDPATTPNGLERCLTDRRVIVCVGTGGVGKTTIAATIALEAARRGSVALVMTIDPARRLAGALGLEALGPDPQEISDDGRNKLGLGSGGRLFAMMLDMKRTFDDLVTRFAEDESVRLRILRNPIYQHVSDALAGSAEYAAMEKVYELLESGRFDLIVLDTPPTQHAIDFLDAPARLLAFIDSALVRRLVHPAFSAGRLGFRIFQSAITRLLALLERLLGMAFLSDLSEFLLAFENMSTGFAERANHVREMLLGPDAGFVFVAGPSLQAARNAIGFLDHLVAERTPLVGLVINRVRLWPDPLPTSIAEADPASLDADLRTLSEALRGARPGEDAAEFARGAVAVATQYDRLVDFDHRNTASLTQLADRLGIWIRRVPELSEDVHDVGALQRVGAALFPSDDPGSPPIPNDEGSVQ
jgi:anion-transporting  ArsA/GET3 family ATPase